MYLLDTNICIYLIKRKPRRVVTKLTSMEVGDVGLSSITVAELQFGVEKSQRVEMNREALLRFIAPLDVYPFDVPAGARYGALRAELERRGKPLGPLDMLIAGHALALGAVLVTNNMREFQRVKGLQLENWTR